MPRRDPLYRCFSCGWYVGKRVLANHEGECPNCCTVVDTAFEPSREDLRELNKRQNEARRNL